jgi:hypothetical protein
MSLRDRSQLRTRWRLLWRVRFALAAAFACPLLGHLWERDGDFLVCRRCTSARRRLGG